MPRFTFGIVIASTFLVWCKITENGARGDNTDWVAMPVIVTRDSVCPGTISPLQYGQFIEYLCDLVPGMWAEKLYDGSFEGLSPYRFEYLRQTDFREKPWYPCGATNRAEYSLDRTQSISGTVCQKIAVAAGAPCTVGIAQDGIAVQNQKACVFSCWMRQEGVSRPIQIQLSRESQTLATGDIHPTAAWTKHTLRVVPSGDEANASLAITFHGPGTLWLDNASLMPEHTIGGWRPDVVAAVRALKPGIIRFGGSALDEPGYGEFDWKQTIGDPDRRKPFRAWGGLQPTGPGLEEIVQLCGQVGAEPLICVRVAGREPKDAAEQVQYFNGSTDTPMGKLRAKNGHPAAYGIKFWQVGNERAGAEYESRLPAFGRAMKEVDPSIKLLSSYPSPGVLKQAQELLDYVCPHHYAVANLKETASDFARIRDLLKKEAPLRQIRVAVTEWNTTAGDAGPKRAKLWTLENALACARYHNLLHRQCDLVEIANRSNLTNSFCSGIIQTDNRRLYKTPTYYAQRLYALYAGSRPLRIDSPAPEKVILDMSATLSADGSVVSLFCVNQSLTDIVRPVDLTAFGNGRREIEIWSLADRDRATEPDVSNSFADPERITAKSNKFAAESGRFNYSFPALSLTVLRWHVRN